MYNNYIALLEKSQRIKPISSIFYILFTFEKITICILCTILGRNVRENKKSRPKPALECYFELVSEAESEFSEDSVLIVPILLLSLIRELTLILFIPPLLRVISEAMSADFSYT